MISVPIMKYSLKNLYQRKSRSFLTIFSIFIGIVTIFIFISFGWGLYDYISDLTTGGSADKIIVQAKGGAAPGLDDTFQLTDDDLDVVRGTAGVQEATGVYFKVAKIEQGEQLKYAFLLGYDPKEPLIIDVFDIGIVRGRELRDGDEGKVVLGNNYLEKNTIFEKAYRINSEIEVQDNDLRVVGFFEEVGNPQDDSQIYMTGDYLKELYPNATYGWIVARVSNLEEMDRVIERIELNLRNERNLDEGKEDFFVQSFQEMLDSYSGALDIVIGFVILIALISVLVSAINTANTMITSVLERYKEIGIIKSIGAKNSEIFNIFLFESGVLGLVAGVLGAMVGWGLAYLGGAILDSLGWGFLSPHFSVWLFVGCVAFATITGAVSGVLPAIRASKINAVDALRYE